MTKRRHFYSSDEDEVILRLRAAGLHPVSIAAELGPTFTGKSINGRLATLKAFTPECAQAMVDGVEVSLAPLIPDYVAELRERLFKAPYRDNTGRRMGDPPLGFAAIDGFDRSAPYEKVA